MKIVNDVEVLTTIQELVHSAHSAVLVIDMQNGGLKTLTYEEPGFERSGTQVSNLAAIVPNLQRLLIAARNAGIFVAYAEWIDRSKDGVPLVNGPHLYCHRDDVEPPNVIEDSWESQTVGELAPQPGDYAFRKSWSSAFHHTGLDDVLRRRNIRSVITVGCITGGCVLKSAVDASHHNYYPVLVRDCVGSYNQESHDLALKWLETKFPVFDREEIEATWLRYGKC
jgi:nicotinamidase-related amidase